MVSPARSRLRAAQAAAYLGLSTSTLAKWRIGRIGPPYHRCGPRIVYYTKEEIDRWQAECDEREQSKRNP